MGEHRHEFVQRDDPTDMMDDIRLLEAEGYKVVNWEPVYVSSGVLWCAMLLCYLDDSEVLDRPNGEQHDEEVMSDSALEEGEEGEDDDLPF